MNKLFEALDHAGIPAPRKSTETFQILRWGHHNRYWLRKFEGGYVFGDFVSGLSSYVFEQEYKGAKLKEVQKKMHDASLELEKELEKSYEQCAKIARRIWDQAAPIENNQTKLSSDSIMESQDAKKESQNFEIESRNERKKATDAYQKSRNFPENITKNALNTSDLRKNQESQNFGENAIKNERHPYLSKKTVKSYGLREYKGNLIVPAYDQDGKLWTLQFISANGEKRFLAGGRKKGCFFTIGLLDNAAKIFICEGYATGATIYECTDKKPVVVAFDANGLKSVSQIISKKVPSAKIIICADNDCYHENNLVQE